MIEPVVGAKAAVFLLSLEDLSTYVWLGETSHSVFFFASGFGLKIPNILLRNDDLED